MRLQTDQEFQQNEIKKNNAANNVTMFIMRTRDGKAKIILLKSKRIEKPSGTKIRPNELIKKVTGNLNKTRSAKYGFTPYQVEKNIIENNNFTNIYDFHRLVRVKEHEDRTVRYAKTGPPQKKKAKSATRYR